MAYLKNGLNYVPALLLLTTVVCKGCSGSKQDDILKTEADTSESIKLVVPADNKIYHAAFPDFGGTEDVVSQSKITDFETLIGKGTTWAYFSNNWTAEKGGVKFPKNEVEIIRKQDKVPFIRMMPRSNFDEGGPDPIYTMDAFLSGTFDADLKQWAIDAKNTNIPLLVEFGTEVNGKWFPWNAKWNQGESKNYGDPNLYDGMEKFRDVYKHIITICDGQGAKNITWFFHVNAYSDPEIEWNTLKGYYPGDEYIDWIGVSAYGAQSPKYFEKENDDPWSFEDVLNDSWGNISAISSQGKPIAILEWGVIDHPETQKAQWISDAIKSISTGGKYFPHIKAISYWHENFDDTNLRIDSSPESLSSYKEAISDPVFIAEPSFAKE